MPYSKKMKVLESLIRMIEKFPYADPAYARLHEDLDRIRGKFKQVCPLCFPWVEWCEAWAQHGPGSGRGTCGGPAERGGASVRGATTQMKPQLEMLVFSFASRNPQGHKDRLSSVCSQLCSLLNVQPDFKISGERSGLSF